MMGMIQSTAVSLPDNVRPRFEPQVLSASTDIMLSCFSKLRTSFYQLSVRVNLTLIT